MQRGSYHRISRFLMVAVALAVGGCSWRKTRPAQPAALPAPSQLMPLYPLRVVDAYIDPPVGWKQDKLEVDSKHTHAVWLSPTGDTAYGIVLMNLPLPVGPDMVLWGFLNHLRQSDKQADLLTKVKAPDLPGLRFVAESGLYRIRVNL